MLKKILSTIGTGFLFGIGLCLTVILLDTFYFDRKIYNSEYFDSKGNESFSTIGVILNRRGETLTVTGEILADSFEKVVYVTVEAIIFLEGKFIESCYGESHYSPKFDKWYFESRCTDIVYANFDEPY